MKTKIMSVALLSVLLFNGCVSSYNPEVVVDTSKVTDI
jgi:PBP1b-binding outer membrane lipoprotein LpoB